MSEMHEMGLSWPHLHALSESVKNVFSKIACIKNHIGNQFSKIRIVYSKWQKQLIHLLKIELYSIKNLYEMLSVIPNVNFTEFDSSSYIVATILLFVIFSLWLIMQIQPIFSWKKDIFLLNLTWFLGQRIFHMFHLPLRNWCKINWVKLCVFINQFEKHLLLNETNKFDFQFWHFSWSQMRSKVNFDKLLFFM